MKSEENQTGRAAEINEIGEEKENGLDGKKKRRNPPMKIVTAAICLRKLTMRKRTMFLLSLRAGGGPEKESPASVPCGEGAYSCPMMFRSAMGPFLPNHATGLSHVRKIDMGKSFGPLRGKSDQVAMAVAAHVLTVLGNGGAISSSGLASKAYVSCPFQA